MIVTGNLNSLLVQASNEIAMKTESNTLPDTRAHYFQSAWVLHSCNDAHTHTLTELSAG